MRKQWLIILFLWIYCSQLSWAEIPPFGKQYYDWVKKESRGYSENLAREHFDFILHTYHNSLYMEGFLLLTKIDADLQRLGDSIRIQSERIDKISDENEQHYIRNYYSSQNQDLVFWLEAQLNKLKAQKESIDSVGSRLTFYQNALYLVGSAQVLESYTQISSGFSSYLPEKYPFSVSVTFIINEDGGVDPGEVEYGQGATIGTIAGIIVGNILGDGPGASIGGFIGGVVGGIYDYFDSKKKEREAQKEYDKQMELVEKGNKLLPKKLLNSEEQYAIYKALDVKYKKEFQAIKDTFDSQFTLAELFFKELSLINLTNKRVARSYLANERLETLKTKYESSGFKEQIVGYSNAIQFLQTLTKDYNFISLEIKAQEPQINLYQLESIHEVIQNNIAILRYAIDAGTYPLIHNELNDFVTRYQSHLQKVEQLLTNSGLGYHYSHSVTGRLVHLLLDVPKAFAPLKNYNNISPQDQRSVPSLGYRDGIFVVEYEWNPYYEDIIVNGGHNPSRDILGSSYDGGLKNYSVQAANDIKKASQNLDSRIDRLKKKHAKLAPIAQKWREEVVKTFERPIVLPSQVQEARELRKNLNQSPILREYRGKIEALLKPENSQLNYIQRQKRLDLLSDFIENQAIPISSSIATPLLEGYGKILTKKEVVFGKLGGDIQGAEAQVDSGSHPSIGSKEEYQNLIGQTEQLATFIENLREANFSSDYIDHYLDELNDLRLRFKGFKTDIGILNINQAPTNHKSVYENGIQSLDQCIQQRGLEQCELLHNLLFNRLSNNRSDRDMVFVGLGNDPNTFKGLSSNLVLGDAVVVFEASDTTRSHYAIILPGYYSKAEEVKVIYIDLEQIGNSRYNVLLTNVMGDLDGLTFYRRQQEVFYGNTQITEVNNQVYTSQCYDVDIGYYDCQQLETDLSYQTNDGEQHQIKNQLNLSESYVKDIQQRYGSNAEFLYQDIHNNLDSYFVLQSVPEPNQTKRYKSFLQSVRTFDQSYQVLVDPTNLHKSQALHELVYLTNKAILLAKSPSEVDQILAEAEKYKDQIIDLTTTFTPGVSDARDIYEFLTGVDLVTQEDIGVSGRVLAGAGLVAGSGILFRKILGIGISTKDVTVKILKQAESLKGFPGMRLIRDGEFKGSMISDKGIIYRKSHYYNSIEDEQHSFFHIASRHHTWGRDKLPRKSDYTRRKDSRYNTQNIQDIVKVNDRAMDLIRSNNPDRVRQILPGHRRYNPETRTYVVKMDDLVNTKKNTKCLLLVFDKTTKYNAIKTSYPCNCNY